MSDLLARCGHDHVLIAGPPPEVSTPRLGESISLHGTLGLRAAYPEAEAMFTSKERLVILLRDQEISFDFDFSTSALRRLGFRLVGSDPPAELIHVDRSRFDRFLYDKVVAHPAVSLRRARVEEVVHAGDRVSSLVLDTGERLEVGYLFDATNAGRILTGPLGIARRDLGDRHRVAFAHFLQDGEPGSQPRWHRETSVVRLYRDRDAVDGLAWCIPLAGKVSVGISLNGPAALSDEAMLDCALARLLAEGIDVRAAHPRRSEVIALDNQYFVHERAFGKNWLLIGPAFANVWWPSGTGVGAAVAASEVAELALSDPLRAGRRYQRYMETLLPMHESLNRLLLPNEGRLPSGLIRRESARRNYSEAERWLMMPRLRRHPLVAATAGVRPMVLPSLLRLLKLCHVTERTADANPTDEAA